MTYYLSGYSGVQVCVGAIYVLVQELYGHETVSAWPSDVYGRPNLYSLMQKYYELAGGK